MGEVSLEGGRLRSIYAGLDPTSVEPVWIEATPSEAGSIVKISTANMELAGEVVQDMCKTLGVSELESQADFPDEIEA
eukprot:CAMPEP_0205946216 /NCGR_PEP_ID=MMETSP1325-20131115/68554_1 /ASSEMBLY_ACC=CAM_ASM_000708 /TAXON_ID=236786 /ORGANISM="Florenciella sp., Strain RCC1007" /LENGTH=77 /DNA_ID=CAMNT_0053317263 /DNA_START=36 /DNA_END=266 /DNA_ORIENTATION=+